MIVIARKYNDIFYSLSIPEWADFESHILIMIGNEENIENPPLLSKFDEFIKIKKSNNILSQIIKELLISKRFKNKRAKLLTISNPEMLSSECLIKFLNPEKVIFLEDGLMNYYEYNPSNGIIKNVIRFCLGVNKKNTINKIVKTYLLAPELAKYYFGKKCKLHINIPFNSLHSTDIKLNENRIFIGVPLYQSKLCTIEEYNNIVNRLIKELGIGIYIPHAYSSSEEYINTKVLNIWNYKLTLELIAKYNNFDIYSFYSSILFTTKYINDNIRTFAIIPKELPNLKIPDMIRLNVNEVLINR